MAERKVVRRVGRLTAGLYVTAFAALSTPAALGSDWVVGAAVLFLVLAALLLQLTLTRARERGSLSRGERLLIPCVIVGVGVGVLGLWFLNRWLGILPGGAWGLSGVCAVYLGAGQLLAEVRAVDARPGHSGLLVSGVCAVLFAAGLAVCLWLSVFGLAAVALALLFAPVGVTLVSEGVLREHRSWAFTALLVGVALVGSAAAWLSYGLDLRPSLTWALLGATLVLVAAIASSTQADVLLVVTIVVLFWAATPFGVAADDTIAPAEGHPTLVALGDSYISGEGATEFFKGTNDAGRNGCRRSPKAYPYLVVEGGKAGAMRRLAFVACSGARMANVIRKPQFRGEPIDDTPGRGKSQLAQLRDLLRAGGADPGLVVVSIGGNDAGFAGIATACLAPGSCVERGQLWLDRLPEVARRMRTAYEEIRKVVGAKVAVLAVPYPVPIGERPCAYSQLDAGEHRFLQGFVEQLDGAIRQSARAAGFYYLGDMVGVLSREKLRICDAPEADIGVNFIRLKSVKGVVDQVLEPQIWLHNSMHPNETGHEAMAAVLAAWIRSHPDPPAKPDPRDEPGAFIPATLDDLLGPGAGSYCRDPAASRPRYCGRANGSWALTKAAGVLAEATPALLLLTVGCWLSCLILLQRTRPAFHALGDRAARLLFELAARQPFRRGRSG